MLRVHLDNLKTSMKDASSLLFSVYIHYDDEKGLLLPGWRLKNAFVSPPASKVGATWFPVVYVTEALGGLIYKELRKVVPKSFPGVVISFDVINVRSLFDDAVRTRLMPGLLDVKEMKGQGR